MFLRPLFCLFLSGRLSKVLLYIVTMCLLGSSEPSLVTIQARYTKYKHVSCSQGHYHYNLKHISLEKVEKKRVPFQQRIRLQNVCNH